MKRVAIDTLGCKVNQFDTLLLKENFKKAGYLSVAPEELADVYIINTCTVTEKADQEARYLCRHYKRQNPKAKIVVTGCYAQMGAVELSKIEEIDFVVGNSDKNNLVDILHSTSKKVFVGNTFINPSSLETIPIHATSEKTRVFLKVQDGCDDFCTFCIIPYARGKSRSMSKQGVVNQIQILVAEGVKEVVLTGVSLGSYGADLTPKETLVSLVSDIADKTGLKRLRISSLEPEDVDIKLLTVLKEMDIFCPHFHLPLQSGHNEILTLMRRNYTTEYYRNLLHEISANFKDVFMGTDVICGFPGETEAHFNVTVEYLKSLPWSKLHVFPYSRRSGTSAVKFKGQLQRANILKRSKILRRLSDERHAAFLKAQIGKPVECLVQNDGTALSRNYLSIQLPKSSPCHPNELVVLTPASTSDNGDCLNLAYMGQV